LGYVINRPPKNIRKHCKFKYCYSQELMYITAIRSVNTENTWIELFIAYCDRKV